MTLVLETTFVKLFVARRADFGNRSTSKQRATYSTFTLAADFLDVGGEHVMHSRVEIANVN